MYPVLVENAIKHLSTLPGIGEKSSLRILLHILKQDKTQGIALAQSLQAAIEGITYCTRCHGFSENALCRICEDMGRERHLCCVVAEVHDALAIEATGQYRGLYHILGGVIKPLQHITPEQLHITDLVERIQIEGFKEVILALNDTSEGGLTMHYLHKRLQSPNVQISNIARGIPLGGELEYIDALTLGQSIKARRAYAAVSLHQ